MISQLFLGLMTGIALIADRLIIQGKLVGFKAAAGFNI